MKKEKTIILIPLLLTMTLTQDNMISLQNGRHIKCITRNKAPLYIEFLEEQRLRNLSLNVVPDKKFKKLMEETTWLSMSSINSVLGPILDKRWEDLETIYTHYYSVTSATSLSFSIYDFGKIEFLINDDRYVDYFSSLSISKQEWSHYTIVLKDGNMYVLQYFLENSQPPVVIRTRNNFAPVEIELRSNKSTYWKIHDYKYWEAKFISLNPTNLTINKEIGSCLMIYSSLCQNCCLHMEIDGKTENICNKLQKDSSDIVNSWQTRNISFDLTKNNVSLKRVSTDRGSEGYWAIDIRRCPKTIKKGNYYIYEATLKPENNVTRICKSLINSNAQAKYIAEENIFNCSEGHFGSNCSTSCEVLLGSESKYCEQYKICQGADCKCAWGFQGEFCKERCQNGSWGLSCKNECPISCSNTCNSITGICEKPSFAIVLRIFWIKTSSLVFVIMVLVLVTCSFLWLIRRCWPCKKNNNKDYHAVSNISSMEAPPAAEEPTGGLTTCNIRYI